MRDNGNQITTGERVWRMLRAVLAAGAIGSLASLPAMAVPTATYTLNVDYCSTGCLFGNTGGTVDLTDQGNGAVLVNVSLQNVDFHGVGGLTSFVFNLNGITSVTISGLPATFAPLNTVGTTTTAGHPGQGNSNTMIHEDGAGDFLFGIDCGTCGPQNGGTVVDTLSFTVTGTGLDAADFALTSVSGSPNAFFAASVFNTTNPSCTGVIGANGSDTPVNGGSNRGTGTCGGGGGGGGGGTIPEPTSLALLGAGLLGIGVLRRTRSRR